MNALSPAIAIVDGASFVLPYDLELVRGLVALGWQVDFYGSRTRYNAQALEAMRALAGVRVWTFDVSGTVASRGSGVASYARLWWTVWRNRKRYAMVNLQFSVLPVLEMPFLKALADKLVFTVHNAVPHGFDDRSLKTPFPAGGGGPHAKTAKIAALAKQLIFASKATHDDFMRRYGDRYLQKSTIIPHGLLPFEPHASPRAYDHAPDVRTLVYWSNVKPYKGVELMAELARSPDVKARGIRLEVHGAWDPAMAALRDELRALGVHVRDTFVDADELKALLARDAVFLLPYRQASQSGALYTLLHQGRVFLCTDVGDLGDFMRSNHLSDLLLADRTPQAVLNALDCFNADPQSHLRHFAAAQAARRWDSLLAPLAPVDFRRS